MRKSLGELINTALSDADSALKLASADDAEIRSSGDFLDAELSTSKLAAEDTFSEKEREGTKKLVEKHEQSMHGKKDEKGEKEEASEKKSSRSNVLNAASYAMKLAEALEIGAHVVAKVAADTDPNTHEQKVTVSTGGAGASPLKAPGPQVMASGFIGAQTVQPKAQSAGAERITGPATTAGNMPTNIADHTGNLDGEQPPNNTGKTAGFTRSKEASARLLRAKQAQAETLMRMGQIKEAERLLAEVEKAAQDPSSPGPELPAHNNSYMLSTEPGDSTMVPDNAGLISMNKAQAKDRSVRTATEYVHEQPKLDNAVAAHALTTQGQKVSSLIVKKAALPSLLKNTKVQKALGKMERRGFRSPSLEKPQLSELGNRAPSSPVQEALGKMERAHAPMRQRGLPSDMADHFTTFHPPEVGQFSQRVIPPASFQAAPGVAKIRAEQFKHFNTGRPPRKGLELKRPTQL